MHNYLSPQICVGSTEVSGKVFVKDDYNFERYNPAPPVNSYWDPSFVSALAGTGSNVSYAQPPLCGDRKLFEWRDTANAQFAIVGNRGPLGSDDPEAMIGNMLESITIELHGGRKEWVGQVCYNDNHTRVEDSVYPEGLSFRVPGGTTYLPDNLFNNDQGENAGAAACAGLDNFLTVCSKMDLSGGAPVPTLNWD
jgi:hypothetical protein